MMRANKQWVDHPDAKTQTHSRPHLKLIVTPPEAPPDTPSDKAVKSVSERVEIAMVILAQAILILGMFLASFYVG